MANQTKRRGVRYGALNSLSGNRVNYSTEGRPPRPTQSESTFWHGEDEEFVEDEFGRRPNRCCQCCRSCHGHQGPGRPHNAGTDCPECETCSGWPLYYTGPCGIVSADARCTGICPNYPQSVLASAQFVAVAPISVSEDGNIDFDFESGDDELFREMNGRIRVFYPGKYLVMYTAQIPAHTDIDTRLAVTLNDERIFGSEVHIVSDVSHEHPHFFAGNALIEVIRGQVIALESTRPFTISDNYSELPIFTMTLVRIG